MKNIRLGGLLVLKARQERGVSFGFALACPPTRFRRVFSAGRLFNGSLGLRCASALVLPKKTSIGKWDGCSDSSQVLCATGNRYRSAKMDSFKKLCREVSRHAHAPVGRRIPWEVTGVHSNF